MLAWMNDNLDLLNMLSSAGMLTIWLLYLHLFYRSYRRQRQPNLLIHQANGFDLDSMCMIANMSANNVHIAALLVDAEREGKHISFRPGPTVPDPLEDEDPLRGLHVGPLTQGSYFRLGSFRTLIAEAETRLRAAAEDDEDDASGSDATTALTVRLVAFVGPELKPIGARRTFEVTNVGSGVDVRPTSLLPEQLSQRRQRRVARAWLEESQALDVERVVSWSEEQRSVERLNERAGRVRDAANGASEAESEATEAREASERSEGAPPPR